jgi:hypothetical protein
MDIRAMLARKGSTVVTIESAATVEAAAALLAASHTLCRTDVGRSGWGRRMRPGRTARCSAGLARSFVSIAAHDDCKVVESESWPTSQCGGQLSLLGRG